MNFRSNQIVNARNNENNGKVEDDPSDSYGTVWVCLDSIPRIDAYCCCLFLSLMFILNRHYLLSS